MARIGVQMMMLKGEVAELGPYQVMRELHQIGFADVEVSQIPMTPENVAQMQRARDDFGTEYAALSATLEQTPHPGSPNESLVTDYDKIIGDLRALGSTRLRIGMLPFAAMASREGLLQFCAEADEMAERLAGEGVTLYFHNHHVEFARIQGRKVQGRKGRGPLLLDLIREQAPNLRFEIDVHWVARGGKDPVRILERYAGLVDLVHLKDFRIGTLPQAAFDAIGDGDQETWQRHLVDLVEFAEIGEGNLEWPEIVAQAEASGAKHLLIEQDQQYGRSSLDCLRTSYENLCGLGFADRF